MPATAQHPLGNLEWVSSSEAIVRTQAGFRKALAKMNANKEYEVQGYPAEYPSYVSFAAAYNGGGFTLFARCVPLRRKEHQLRKRLEAVQKHMEESW